MVTLNFGFLRLTVNFFLLQLNVVVLRLTVSPIETLKVQLHQTLERALRKFIKMSVQYPEFCQKKS